MTQVTVSLLLIVFVVAYVQATSDPGPPLVSGLGSLCPSGWNSCNSDGDCRSGCCFQLSQHLPAKCCAHPRYLNQLRSTGACFSKPPEPEPVKIGMCEPRRPRPSGPLGCPYIGVFDECRTDEDCPIGPAGTPLLCCPTDHRPGCYAGRRCSNPILA